MKTYEEIIKKLSLFDNRDVLIEPLRGGLTNKNFRVIFGKKNYVARFALPGSEYLGLNRSGEYKNYQIASKLGIGPRPIKYFSKDKLLLVEYIPGEILSETEAKKPRILKQFIQVLKKLHNGPKFQGKFDTVKVSLKYFKLLSGKWLPKEARNIPNDLIKISKKIGRFDMNYSCHLDLYPPNVIKSNGRIKLIDWEYAAVFDFRYDLGYYSMFSDFTKIEDELMVDYYNHPKLDYKRLLLFKALAAIREIGWDLVSAKYSKVDFDFKNYAMENLKKYQKVRKLIL